MKKKRRFRAGAHAWASRSPRGNMATRCRSIACHNVLASAAGVVLTWASLWIGSAWGQEDAPWKAEIEALQQEIRQAAEGKDTDSKFHMAGYAAINFADPEEGNSSFTGTTFNPIFHYSYKDWLLLDAELEIALEDEGATETALEFMNANLVLSDAMVLVAGKFLSPVGMFRRNLHPAWVNKLPSAPLGFEHGQAAPLADIGLQLTGGVPLGAMRANYAVYTGNGPMIELNPAGTEVEMVGTEGQGTDMNGNKAIGGRIGFVPVPKLEIGLSYAQAKATDEEGMAGERDYKVRDVDFAWQIVGLDLRGEYVRTTLGEGPALAIDPEEKEWKAWYTQAAYRLPATNWQGVLRYGEYDRPGSAKTKQWTPGVNYLFASHVIARLAYEANDTDGVEDDDRLLLQLAYGF